MMELREDLINEVRTVQKSTKRMAQKMVESGHFPRGGEYARFFITLNTLYYFIVDDLVESTYGVVQTSLMGETPDKPESAQGGLFEWLRVHLNR